MADPKGVGGSVPFYKIDFFPNVIYILNKNIEITQEEYSLINDQANSLLGKCKYNTLSKVI